MKKFLGLALIASALIPSAHAQATTVGEDVAGKILLQVERRGEAWYVHPETKERHFLYRSEHAYYIMREQGIGITNADLSRIPIGYFELNSRDTDGDGLPDRLEQAIGTDANNADTDGDGYDDGTEIRNGYDPLASGKKAVSDTAFARMHAGKIFIQVEGLGESWWVNPADNHRYYLGLADEAYDLLRAKGLGITTTDLEQVPIASKVLNCSNRADCIYDASVLGVNVEGIIEWAVHFNSTRQWVTLRYKTERMGDSMLLHVENWSGGLNPPTDNATCTFDSQDKVKQFAELIKDHAIKIEDMQIDMVWDIHHPISREVLSTCALK